MTVADKVKSIVRRALEKRFPKMRILHIEVVEAFGHDLDPLFKIRVVFDDAKSQFDAGGVIEIPRLIMPELAKANASGFPILSFVAKSDLGKLRPAAA